MAIYGMMLEKQDAVSKWIAETDKRSKEENFFKNPFKLRMKFWLRKKEVLLIMDIKPLYFNFSVFGWFMSAGALFMFGFGWWLWPGIILGCLGVFWTADFYFFMAKLGLRKAGYKGKIKRLKLGDIIREVIF